ncbi:MAG TPA: Na+/H+ antiporter NhaA [Rhodocyclaceae bacterium]|nr:Na+/H+ antiporter NhaA [Rhodocyclaceae bacterium]
MSHRLLQSISKLLHTDAFGGGLLLAITAIALVWANSPAADSYEHLWHLTLPLGIGNLSIVDTLHFWINDGLMTFFFLVVGMEIRQEIHAGALSSVRQAALPVIAAIGGVCVPALIYLLLNPGDIRIDAQARGWAVPTATDIAFAVGILALLGKSIPANLRILLLALAIIDDIVAVLIIALFYSGGLATEGLLIVGAGIALVLVFQRCGVASAWAYVLPGAIIWLGLLKAGAHPTLAGVVLGLLTPATTQSTQQLPPVIRVQKALHPWVSLLIMPLFALANAGVGFGDHDWSDAAALHVMLGVALALVIGKPLGVMVVSWLAVRLGWCRLPTNVTWEGVALVGLLAGIGFTMSIFIAMLAFTDPQLLGSAKLGVLIASACAAILALLWGYFRVRDK